MRRSVKFALAALLLAAPAAEGMLRLYGFGRPIRFRPDRRLGWEMVPNQHAFNVRGRAAVRTNRFGFRGPDPVDDSSLRVLYLGDGVVLGNQSPEAETFPFRCERLLEERQPGRSVQTLVGAASGYQLEQELELLLERGQELRPQAIVVGFCWNDWAPTTMRGPGLGPPANGESAGPRNFFERTALCDFKVRLTNILHRRKQAVGYRAQAGAAPTGENDIWLHVRSMLDSLRTTADGLGASVLLCVLPSELVDLSPERYAARAGRLRAWAAAHHIPYVDPQTQPEVAGNSGIYLDALHLNASGHRVVAEALLSPLEGVLYRREEP